MAGIGGRTDFKKKADLQKENNEKSVGSSSNEHSASTYGQLGFHSRPTDDLLSDGRATLACYNASNLAAMNATRVKALETFNLYMSDDHCTLNFDVLEDRFVTFIQWQGPLDYQLMAEAGFVYTGQEDLVFCFHCGIKLDRWSKDMEPLLRHKEESPTCSFMRQRLQAVKGERGKTKSVVAPSKPLNPRLTSSIGQLQSSSLIVSKAIHTVVTGLNEPRLSYGGSFDDRPGASLPITAENCQSMTKTRVKRKSEVATSSSGQHLAAADTNMASFPPEGFCTTKLHQWGNDCSSTTKEVFKSANDSISIGSQDLEQLTVRCVCLCMCVCYCCQSFSWCIVAYPTVMVVIVTMKTGFHYWDPAVKVFIFLVTVNYQ